MTQFDFRVGWALLPDCDQVFDASGVPILQSLNPKVKLCRSTRNLYIIGDADASTLQFWDGRANRLEDQAILPISNPIEMGNTHDSCIQTLKAIPGYAAQFDTIFREGITIENVGRAIAAFERAIVTGPTAYDYNEYVSHFRRHYGSLENVEARPFVAPELVASYKMLLAGAKAMPLTESAQRGKELFFGKGKCATCHMGPNFTDEKYHNIGVGLYATKPDLGRYHVTKRIKDRSAFKTPTVRNVAYSGPYMHDGSLVTLEQVVEWYDSGGQDYFHLTNRFRSGDERKPLNLTAQERADLVAFMRDGLSGSFPEVERGRLPR